MARAEAYAAERAAELKARPPSDDPRTGAETLDAIHREIERQIGYVEAEVPLGPLEPVRLQLKLIFNLSL